VILDAMQAGPGNLEAALLALLAALVSAGIWTVKALMSRSDRLMESRDKQLEQSIATLVIAVDSFRKFELAEAESHHAMLTGMQALNDNMVAMKTAIDEANARGRGKNP